jgi:negative regulator of sigma-B (phosphoserine phosphatase)
LGAIKWGVASKPFPGQTESGDLHLVAPRPDGTLIAVIDGLGHGREAAEASVAAVSILLARTGDDIVDLMRRCDSGLKNTRGVVMNLAALNRETHSLVWGGVGNVNGVIIRHDARRGPERQRLAPRPGLIGTGIAQPRSEETALYDGDVLIFATDGITSSFADKLDVPEEEPPERVASRIVENYWAGRDDVLVLVARCLGA